MARRRRADAEAATPQGMLLITGLSGAGRSEAARSLEDIGYFVVDNLPPALLPKMAELAASPGGPGRVAIVVDARPLVLVTELRGGEHVVERCQRLFEAADQRRVSVRWVRGHNGDRCNEKADALANKALALKTRSDA